ncbi:Aldehyde dehydrogenase family 16 member A1 like protein [Argiope bruennichi]|uniref:Aldehyde dehydrogenase family 16 member A1 like protein n=1 Tax=Argiope bruennichi TaxID=94029 RepID=A0A8T0EXJ7_ARGBR|nr:Aldehyde dehydrogenase family 16 member A1 like protein [Argiope bruennichi]
MERASLQGIPCEISVTKQPIVFVYEDADLHSAADGILGILQHSDTRSERSGCRVFVQASIQKKFLQILEEKFSKLSVGFNLQQIDLTCTVTKEQKEQLVKDVEEAKSQGFKVVEGPEVNVEKGQFRATLLENLPLTSTLYREVAGGPIVITTTFRTVKESISMFNYNKLGCDVSIWSERLTLALEVANQLRAGTVWINSQNIFDACAVYGGAGLGSGSLEGGKEAFLRHLNVGVSEIKKYDKAEAEQEIELYGKDLLSGNSIKNNPEIRLSFDLHIGGSYKKPSENTYLIVSDAKKVPYAYIANGTSSDLTAAISSACDIQPKWENQSKYKLSDILRKVATTLTKRKEEFAVLLQTHGEKKCSMF